jgi:hypothetical protein
LAGQGLLKIACLLTRCLFRLAAQVIHDDAEKNAELPVPGTRTRCCAGTPAGYGTSPVTGPGSPRSCDSSRAGAGQKSPRDRREKIALGYRHIHLELAKLHRILRRRFQATSATIVRTARGRCAENRSWAA